MHSSALDDALTNGTAPGPTAALPVTAPPSPPVGPRDIRREQWLALPEPYQDSPNEVWTQTVEEWRARRAVA